MSTTIGNDILLSLDEAVAEAKDQLRIDITPEHDDYLEARAQDAVLHMGDKASILTKTEVFDVVDGTVCLPRGFYLLRGIGYPNDDVNPDLCTCVQYLIGHNGCCDDFYIQNGYIVFNRPEQIHFHRIILLYETKNLDCHGLFYMTAEQQRGIVAYCCWKFTQKFFDRYPPGTSVLYMKEWEAQAAKCRSLTAQRNFRENRNAINYYANNWMNQRWTWWGALFPNSGFVAYGGGIR